MKVAVMSPLPLRIRSKSDYKQFLQADLRAHGLRSWRFDYRWRHPALRFQRALRRVEYLQTCQGAVSRVLRFIARFDLERWSLATGIVIQPGVCGPGLSIAHPGTLIVNSRAQIGAFCRLHPLVTIGIADGGVPTIGDFVYVGPGAVIYGSVHVGDQAVVGANSVVSKDVPPMSTVAGAPARVVGARGSARLMPSFYPLADDVRLDETL